MNPQDEEVGELLGPESVATPAIHFRSFSTREAAAVVGISVGKLQNWLTRGAIQLEGAQNPGRGQSRNYSAYEVARIALMKRLSEYGVPLETSFKITSALKSAWTEVAGGHEAYGTEPDLQSWLVVLLTSDWPAELKRSSVRANDHIAVWIVDQITKPDPSTGLTATLRALNSAPAIIVNMGKILHETVSKLEGVPAD
jgi:DNA-binding transcriptional MerR regulator